MNLSRRGLLAASGALGVVAATAGTASAQPARSGRVCTGFDRLAADGYRLLDAERVGIVTNPTGITGGGTTRSSETERGAVRHIVDVMHADDRVKLTAVFGPEHGFRGTAQAGGSEGRYDDPATGLPVYDTYLKSGQPLADIFTASGVDTVVFDIQDVGARFYTVHLDAVRLHGGGRSWPGKRFVVLDRPNPVTGRAALGPVLHREFATLRRTAADLPGARDDGGGAGAAVQRGVPGRAGGAGHRTDVGVEAVGVLRRVGSALGAAEPEHADARHRPGVLGDLSLRGRRTCRRGAVRPARSSCWAPRASTGGGQPAAQRLEAAGRALQGGVLRADLLQVPGQDDRRRADPCARPGGLRPGAYRRSRCW